LISTINLGLVAQRRLDRLLGLEGHRGRHLERHVAVCAVRLLEHRAQQVGRVADVAIGQTLEDLLRVLGLVDHLAEGVVVAIGMGHRLLEDRRVGGHPADPVLLDQAGHDPVLEQLAADVVDPDRLALGLNLVKVVAHVVRSVRRSLQSLVPRANPGRPFARGSPCKTPP
jgi:hypothetical protein